MKTFIFLILLNALASNVEAQQIESPDKNLRLDFYLSKSGEPLYFLQYKNQAVVETSLLGFSFADGSDFSKEFSLIKTDTLTHVSSWNPVLGEFKTITNHYKELVVFLKQNQSEKEMTIRFRLFNDGLGFRYEFPLQKNMSYFVIQEEKTQFSLTGNHTTFWIPGDFDSNEYTYSKTRLSEVSSLNSNEYNYIVNRTILHDSLVQTPLLMKTDNNLYISIFEAGVLNFPVMHLDVNRTQFGLTSHLVKNAVGSVAFMQTPEKTPWRTIHVTNNAASLLTSTLILNLNEPSRIKQTNWIKPMKYVGIWWGMHVGIESWNFSDVNNVKLGETDWNSLKPNGRHGATTKNTKRYIDFAAKHGFDGVLVEGWNVGWEDWYGNWKEEVFDFVTPYPDFDVKEVSEYAKKKGVKMIMHHETSASVTNYERRLSTSLDFMQKYGYPAVKTGYVGFIVPRGEHHDGQWMSRHFSYVAEEMAKRQIMVNMHESHRPTGLHRTYPNWIASEAARGNEFNAWSSGNPPEHETILPFTRLLGGPMDYTPGIFEIKLSHYSDDNAFKVRTTLAKQLALYVTMYSPLQMAADLPENYERYSDAFQFIKDVAMDWDDTQVLEAEPGEMIVITRKKKNAEEWFLGGITNEKARVISHRLSFLNDKITYVAQVYQDAENAHWDKNPKAYVIKKGLVTKESLLELRLAEGGGVAIRFYPASKEEIKKLKKLD